MWTVVWASDVHQPLSSGLSFCLSVPFSPLSFHLHFSFVERNSRLLARTIAHLLAYERSGGAASEAGKGRGHKTSKSVPSRQLLISLMAAHVPMWQKCPLGKCFSLKGKKTTMSCFSFKLVVLFIEIKVKRLLCVDLFCLTVAACL